jgi:DNA-binding response OmpR family regulator
LHYANNRYTIPSSPADESIGEKMTNYVLVVEDDERQIAIYQRELEGAGLEVLIARDLESATLLVRQYRAEIIAMIIDGAVPGSYLSTIPFIQWVKENETRAIPKVAASTRDDYRLTMVQYGCTDEAPKRYAVQKVVTRLQQLGQLQ